MKLACITGASSGIGKEFAYLLSDLEYDLILVGRNSAALHEIADNVAVRCKCITCDLSDEKSCVKLGKKLRKYPLDIMINNAGFGELGTFAETKLKNDINMINVNIKAVHILTKAVLPGFIQRDRGYIMNVASSAGLLPGGPYMIYQFCRYHRYLPPSASCFICASADSTEAVSPKIASRIIF